MATRADTWGEFEGFRRGGLTMKGKLASVLIMAAILSLVIVVPVSAKQPLRGWLEVDWNDGFQDEATPCPEIVWAGSIEIDGVLYGWAWVGTLPREAGRSVHYGTSEWMIYESPFAYDGGVFDECGAEIAVLGSNVGLQTPVGSVGNGTVEWVNPDGSFDVMLTGRRVHISGSFPSPGEFSGWFRIN
jgi:hypothetical protein